MGRGGEGRKGDEWLGRGRTITVCMCVRVCACVCVHLKHEDRTEEKVQHSHPEQHVQGTKQSAWRGGATSRCGCECAASLCERVCGSMSACVCAVPQPPR